MAILTPTKIQKSGIANLGLILSSADAGGDQCIAGDGLIFVMKNSDSSTHTMTLVKPSATINTSSYGALGLTDITLVVGAGDIGMVVIPSGYADDGKYLFTYDAVTAVTVGVVRG